MRELAHRAALRLQQLERPHGLEKAEQVRLAFKQLAHAPVAR
jgi:hypothetical protein